ncbi:MAG: MFS transporter [Sporolactobacillus sp.]
MIKYQIRQFYIASMLYFAGITVWSATLNIYLKHVGYSYIDINSFTALFFIISFLTEIPSGILSDSFGRKNAVLLSCLLRIVGLGLLCIPIQSFTLLMSAAVLTACSESLNSGALSAWIVDQVKNEDKNYPIETIFSNGSVYFTIMSMALGFLGAELLGPIQLVYPIFAGIFILVITMVYMQFLFKDTAIVRHQLFNKRLKKEYSEVYKSGTQFVKTNRLFAMICLGFLPTFVLLASPGEQWSLYFIQFTRHGSQLIGFLWVLMAIAGIVGSKLAPRINRLRQNKAELLIATLTANVLAILGVSFAHNIYLAIILFLIHVMITSVEAVIRQTLLHNQIRGNSRNMLTSVFAAFESLITAVTLVIAGYLSDLYSIAWTWRLLGFFSLILAVPILLLVRQKINQQETEMSGIDRE